jgi:hypothetical protein
MIRKTIKRSIKSRSIQIQRREGETGGQKRRENEGKNERVRQHLSMRHPRLNGPDCGENFGLLDPMHQGS